MERPWCLWIREETSLDFKECHVLKPTVMSKQSRFVSVETGVGDSSFVERDVHAQGKSAKLVPRCRDIRQASPEGNIIGKCLIRCNLIIDSLKKIDFGAILRRV